MSPISGAKGADIHYICDSCVFDTEKRYLKMHCCLEDAVCWPRNIKEEKVRVRTREEEGGGGNLTV